MSNPENSAPVLNKLKYQLDLWANNAYRTLLFAYKDMDYKAFLRWRQQYDLACSDMNNYKLLKQNLPNPITTLRQEIESNLIYQGATCIEDRLQENVDITIDRLIHSGIHVWMITGDKVGTAKNIAMSCNLYQVWEFLIA